MSRRSGVSGFDGEWYATRAQAPDPETHPDLATTVSVTRVTGLKHFPADVAVGGVFGYLIGQHIFHAHSSFFHAPHTQKTQREENVSSFGVKVAQVEWSNHCPQLNPGVVFQQTFPQLPFHRFTSGISLYPMPHL